MIKLFNTSFVRALNLTNFFYNSTKFFSSVMAVNITKNNYSTFSNSSKKIKNYSSWFHKEMTITDNDSENYINLDEIKRFLSSLKKDQNYVLIIIIMTEEGLKIATKQKIININRNYSADTLLKKVNGNISDTMEFYQVTSLYNVVFRYREFITILPEAIPTKTLKINIPSTRKKINNVFSNFYAPFSLDASKFGKLIEDKGDIKIYLYMDRFYLEREFSPIKNQEIYKIRVLTKENKDLIYEIVDTRLGISEFIREIGDFKLHIKRGVLIMHETKIKCNFIEPRTPDYIPSDKMSNFITYDLECYLDENNEFVPYAAAWHKNGVTKTYYLSEYSNPQDLILTSIKDLLIKNNKNCVVYIHNNKNFDSIYIINSLIGTNLHIDPLLRDKKSLCLPITKNKGKKDSIKIILKDSYLLLPSSLRKLCKSYKVKTVKSIFPHLFASLSTLNLLLN